VVVDYESESENRLDLVCRPKELVKFPSPRECAVTFRIRNPDSDDFAKYEKAYYRHLEQFKKSSNTNLWKFFGWDFFHDGDIGSIEIQGDLKTVVIRLNCPNVKRFKPDGEYEYINVGFSCTFRNVSTFTIQYETPERCRGVRASSTLFLDAEINTSPMLAGFKALDDADADHIYSLFMQLLGDDSTIWVELIFSQVDVIADEPTAFALMEVDPKFDVPTWSPDKTGK
jgi:hypothetical protein